MKFEDFKKLKTKMNDKNFFNNYRGFSKLSHWLSYVGNFFSIIFAYFFIYQVIISSVTDPTPNVEKLVMFISVVILTTLEMMKRFVFDKFTQISIKEKFTFKEKESKVLGFICLCLIATSFYFSIHGAEQYADKKDEIQANTSEVVDAYSDSLSKKYENKIIELETQNKLLFDNIQAYNLKIENLNKQGEDGSLSKRELGKLKSETNKLKNETSKNLEKNEIKIKEIKEERDKEIEKFESKKTKNADKKIEDTSSNPFMFLIFSTVIEFLILFGIWFINYYEIRSVEEYEKLISKDPKFKAYNNWVEFINIIFKQDSRNGDVLPYKTEMLKLFKTNNIDIGNKEYDDLIKVFVHLGILKPKGNKKSIAVSKEEALELIKTHLKVE